MPDCRSVRLPSGPPIGVVVVAYRSAATIGSCVRSCLADPDVRSVVVQDNSSDPTTAQAVAAVGDAAGRVSYVAAPNVGYAAGCNAGAALLGTGVEWLAFVNPDVELERPLGQLLALLAGSALGPPTVAGAYLESPRSPGTPSARVGVTRWRELAKAVVGSRTYAMRPLSGEGPVSVEQVSGALLLVRRVDFDALGGFDERYELYYEDVDLCARAASMAGCLFLPQRWGRHVGGASASTAPGPPYVAARISRMRYLRAHAPGRLTDAALLVVAGAEALTRSVARGSEGGSARRQALRAQLRELRRPGSVRVLR